ncbi:hypothetical protein PCIT_a3499 [Pseudoalteromonas citrea]|uniref:histidine kinase n=2 Tax=Pseudoalteromonas citrea TaxID=43655 RepID=A0AAD4FR91_9GAMM|nr:response regulator [Pseudoalteromonas citrea]KAF7768963.1 hypothetical protein PCIT_a3499 [Pseudoalteromonas citrea]
MRQIIKSMRSRYVIAVVVMAILVTLAAAAMQYLLQQKQQDAELINRAGMQRMLSQKIALHVNQLVLYAQDDKPSDAIRMELEKSVSTFLMNHQFILREKDGEYEFLSTEQVSFYFAPPVNLMQRSEDFLALYKQGEYTAELAYEISGSAQELLFYLNQAVKSFEHSANRKVEMTRIFEFVFWVSAVVLLCLEVVYIFQPMERQVKRVIESLEQQKQETQHALTMKTHFLARASHELRTPLQAILGFLNLYRQDGKNEQLLQVEVSAKQLVNQLNAIQEFSRWEKGDIPVSVIPEEITKTLLQAISPYKLEAQRKGVTLRTEFEFDKSLNVACDHDHLAWVVGQLIDNALKFTEQGSVTLKAALCESQNFVLITVLDTGCGFSGASPFSTNVDDTHFQGLQLGLVRCKWLLDAMNAEINFEKGEKSGTNVYVKVPIYMVEGTSKGHTEQKKITSLLVEDNPLNAVIIKKILETLSIGVKHVEHGLAAIDDLSSNQYDVIFMDLNMPVMDGFQAIEYIRNSLNLVEPIIVVTANSEPIELERAKTLGANATVVKPLDAKSVRQALTHVGVI